MELIQKQMELIQKILEDQQRRIETLSNMIGNMDRFIIQMYEDVQTLKELPTIKKEREEYHFDGEDGTEGEDDAQRPDNRST